MKLFIEKCTCTADKFGNTQGAKFQDKTYGPGKRLFTTKKDDTRGTCTVCGAK